MPGKTALALFCLSGVPESGIPLPKDMEEEFPRKTNNIGDHLANERTFLAWIRTSIGIMGFGFVVVKFSLFIRQISLALGTRATVHQTGNSQKIGILLVALGAMTIIFAFIRYQKTRVQLEKGGYYHSTLFIKIITVAIFLFSILLLIYLMRTT
ncbi:YidH family protein [Pedobacter sp.]|uniref:YidH family protein n=1 Tax=Pedobacter sp. TaxID=1411316 RepID=UPI003C6AA721